MNLYTTFGRMNLSRTRVTTSTLVHAVTRFLYSTSNNPVKEWSINEEYELYQRAIFLKQNWNEVAKEFQGRTCKECEAKWKEIVKGREQSVLFKTQKKARFFPEDDDRLSKEVRAVQAGNPEKRLETFEWTAIAKKLGFKTTAPLRYRWEVVLDPCRNNLEWTSAEQKKLETCIAMYGRQWMKIQKLHFPNRSSHQLRGFFIAAQRRKEPPIMRPAYTEEQFVKVDKLINGGKYIGRGGDNVRWGILVRNEFPELVDFVDSFRQCYRRSRIKHPCTVLGRWSPAETERLLAAVAELKPKYCDLHGNVIDGFWVKVAEQVGGRTMFQCKYRYNYLTNQKGNNEYPHSWSYMETLKMLELCDIHALSWVAIVRDLPQHRSPQACREKFLMCLGGQDQLFRSTSADLVRKFGKESWLEDIQRKKLLKEQRRNSRLEADVEGLDSCNIDQSL